MAGHAVTCGPPGGKRGSRWLTPRRSMLIIRHGETCLPPAYRSDWFPTGEQRAKTVALWFYTDLPPRARGQTKRRDISMQSMTGYGRSEVHDAQLALTVEARSVNHRYLDIALRYPRLYAPLEARMKQRVSAHFTRGRIDITLVQQESPEGRRALSLDHVLAQQYYDALQRLQESLHLPGVIDVNLIAGLRDVFKVEEPAEDIESAWDLIAQGLDAALQALKRMRQQEGEALGRDFHLRLQTMAQQIQAIRHRVPQVVVEYRQRLEQ